MSCFTKDFVKLKSEPDNKVLRYFVMYIKSYTINDKESTNYTIKSLSKKILALDKEDHSFKDERTKFYCYVLEPKKEQKNRIEDLILQGNS
jgi:hypothetical protein